MKSQQHNNLKQDLHNDNIGWHPNVDKEILPGSTPRWRDKIN